MTRQRLYRTPAVILKRMDLGEADRIVTLYSRDVGKIRAVAKGVRRTTSRSALVISDTASNNTVRGELQWLLCGPLWGGAST